MEPAPAAQQQREGRLAEMEAQRGAAASVAGARREACLALVSTLRSQCPEKGFLFHEGLEFGAAESTGEVWVQLRAAVTEGEILLVVPHSAVLCKAQLPDRAALVSESGGAVYMQALLEDVAKRFRQHVLGESPLQVGDVQQILLVMNSLHAEWTGDGPWARQKGPVYAATWPAAAEMGHLAMYWTEETLAASEGTMAGGLVKALHVTARQIFDDVLAPALADAGVSRCFVPASDIDTAVAADLNGKLWEAYRHAVSIQMSRAHDGEAGPELVPLVDLIDGVPQVCSSAANVELAAGKWPFISGNTFRNDCDLDCSAIYALRDIAVGERLLISYGDVSPSG